MTQADLTLPPRTRLGVIAAGVVFHVVLAIGLIRAFTPDIAAAVVDKLNSVLTVTFTSPEPETPAAPETTGEEGAAAPEGRKAKPSEAAAPEPDVRLKQAPPASRAASTGNETDAGARNKGEGTGAGGVGRGAGAGGSGFGQGGGLATKPSVRSGELNEARDFPVPDGGRQTRFGKSVTVAFTVTADGRARDCSVLRSGVDAATAARVCPLVIEKIRFNPATRADGTPVETRYGYRVDFKER